VTLRVNPCSDVLTSSPLAWPGEDQLRGPCSPSKHNCVEIAPKCNSAPVTHQDLRGTSVRPSAFFQQRNLPGEPTVTHPNDPDRPDILRRRDDSLGGTTVGGIAVAIVLLLGIVLYMLSTSHRDLAGVDSPRLENPSTTTGQGDGKGGTSTMPGRDQNVTNPVPPVQPMPKQPRP